LIRIKGKREAAHAVGTQLPAAQVPQGHALDASGPLVERGRRHLLDLKSRGGSLPRDVGFASKLASADAPEATLVPIGGQPYA